MNKKEKSDLKSSEYLANFLNFVRRTISEYDLADKTVNECEKATQDILHQFELGTYDDRLKYATRLSHIRKERRVYKDFMEINSALYELYKRPDFIKLIHEMENILGEVRKQEKRIETNARMYNPRILKDLPITTSETKEHNSNG